MTYDYNEWLKNPIKIFCKCGCGEEIIIKRNYKWRNIPEYVQGHNNRIYPIKKSYQKWLDDGCPKVYCNCGCNIEIIVKNFHKYNDIPKYIKGHQSIGKHRSEETKQKIRNANKNHPVSKETREKIRKKNSGKNASMYGKPPSPKSGYGKWNYYNSPLQGKIRLRSSYELKFTKYLDKNNILWLYEIQTFDLGNNTYTPDFFLPTSNLFIEIKGYMMGKAQDKINKFLDNYPEETLQILYKEDLLKLGCEI